MLHGKIFVTGGAGFLGRGLIRRAEREDWPCKFTIFSRDEEKQFLLSRRFGDRIKCLLGDIRDQHSLYVAMRDHDAVIHAGAVKFIPEAEKNVWECLKTNIDGSRNVIRAAVRCRVSKVINISTDKACLPANVYGMSKALGERMTAEANGWSRMTTLGSVRYGNVVGSTGSIIPRFYHQLKEEGKVKVTDPRMTRFWLSVDEAIDLILLALKTIETIPGAVVVPKCGAMRIQDLAEMIAGSAPVEEIGIRPGEKLHEQLIQAQEAPRVEQKGDHFIVRQAIEPSEGEGWTYTSSNPARWIEQEEMMEMIQDAKGIETL